MQCVEDGNGFVVQVRWDRSEGLAHGRVHTETATVSEPNTEVHPNL